MNISINPQSRLNGKINLTRIQLPQRLFANIRPRLKVNTVTFVKRSLSGSGSLHVVKNQEVQPHDILGKSAITSGFSVISLAKKLDAPPTDAQVYLQKPIGSIIFKDELLAFKKTIFGKKIITSPTDCVIDSYDSTTGKLRLKFLPREVPLSAGVVGIVEEVDRVTNEVWIKTIVTEVYGLYGSGIERNGILNTINDQGLVQANLMTPQYNNQIIITNGLVYGSVLKKAVRVGVRGIISGGFNAGDITSIAGDMAPMERIGSDIGMTLLATEGYGPVIVGSDINSLIHDYQGRFVFLNGNAGRLTLPSVDPDSILVLRKTALPFKRTIKSVYEVEVGEIEVGCKVRVVGSTLMGVQGTVVAVDKASTLLESGILTVMLTVETASQKIKIPYPNVEILK